MAPHVKRGQQDMFGAGPPGDDVNAIADAAMRAIRSVAERLPEFTTDQVVAELTDWTIAEPRLLGPAMIRARDQGWITRTNRTVPTTNPQAHSRPKAIWISRLYKKR